MFKRMIGAATVAASSVLMLGVAKLSLKNASEEMRARETRVKELFNDDMARRSHCKETCRVTEEMGKQELIKWRSNDTNNEQGTQDYLDQLTKCYEERQQVLGQSPSPFPVRTAKGFKFFDTQKKTFVPNEEAAGSEHKAQLSSTPRCM